jgi:hypothetical protein
VSNFDVVRFAIVALLLLMPDCAAAQIARLDEHQQRVDTVRRRLASSDPKEVAWGAFTVASYQLTALGLLQELRPDLIAALERTTAAQNAPALPWLLDAIVQTRTQVPASTLAPHVDRYPVQTMLAFRDATGDVNSILIAQLATVSGDRWYGAANLLLDHHSPRFAAALLDTTRLRLVVHLVDKPADNTKPGEIITGGSGGGAGVADGMGMNYAGFPPTVEYRFAYEWPDAIVASTGPVTVHYSRHIHDQYQFGVAWPTRGGPTADERLRYLQSLTSDRYAQPWRFTREVTVPWRDDQDALREARDSAEELQHQYDFMLRALVSAGALTDEERKARGTAPIDIEVDDRRSDRGRALPTLIPRQR